MSDSLTDTMGDDHVTSEGEGTPDLYCDEYMPTEQDLDTLDAMDTLDLAQPHQNMEEFIACDCCKKFFLCDGTSLECPDCINTPIFDELYEPYSAFFNSEACDTAIINNLIKQDYDPYLCPFIPPHSDVMTSLSSKGATRTLTGGF
jgi:hypothetical protein